MEAMLVIIGTVVGFAIGWLARGRSIPWTTDEMNEMIEGDSPMEVQYAHYRGTPAHHRPKRAR
jgi:hypothetical protein